MTVPGPPDASGLADAKPAPDVTPQPVLSPLTAAAVFLVATVNHGGEHDIRDLLGDLPALQRSVGFRIPEGKLA